MFGFITDFLLLFCCKLYPVFGSFKAIRRRDGDEYARWLMYWITFALFLSVTYFTDMLLFWIPLYGIAKLGIAIWLLPFFRGSKILYLGLVHPNLVENEMQLEMFVNSISGRLLSLGRVLFSFALQKTTEVYTAHALSVPIEPPVSKQPSNPPETQYPPPSYSTVMTSDQPNDDKERKEFSDDEDYPQNKRIASVREDESEQPVSKSPEPPTPDPIPRTRDTPRQSQRPRSELPQTGDPQKLSRQKSPHGRAVRTQSDATETDRPSERRRTTNRQQTLDATRSKKQEKI